MIILDHTAAQLHRAKVHESQSRHRSLRRQETEADLLEAWFPFCFFHANMSAFFFHAHSFRIGPRRIFIKNLPFEDIERLKRDFGTKGMVDDVQVTSLQWLLLRNTLKVSLTQKSTKFACEVWRRGDEIQGYVRYQTVEAAASAVSSWHNSWYCEFKLSVEFARRG